jgi:E3 ubiquitin-protein ligase HECW2
MNQDALFLYNRNPTLKHMIVRIRRDPAVFDKYQHNKELVALVNMFADTNADLPEGWDTKKDRNAKVRTLTLNKMGRGGFRLTQLLTP